MNNKRRNFRLTFAAAAALLAVIAFFLVSVLGNLPGARLDLTRDRLFTMSPAAAEVLKGLKVPVQVKLYITPADKMPTQLRTLERDLTERMRNFEQVAGGMLEFSVYNPQNDEEMQKTLGAKGIRPFQVQSIEKDEMGIKLIWSAMTIAYKDQPEEVLPQLLPQSLGSLEQDVIGPIYRLTREKAPKVAVFGPKKEVDRQLAMMYLQQGMQPPAPQEQYSRLREVLQQEHYEVVPVELTPQSPVPADADMLVVMASTPLNERQAWEINRALTAGIPVVMAVQAHEYGYAPSPGGGWSVNGQDIATGLEPMLAGFGLTVSEDHFLDSAMEVIELPREINLGGLRVQTREPVRAPIQIRVTESQMNPASPMVNRIGSLFYLWGTPVVADAAKLSAAGLGSTTLMSSSADCWQEPWSEGPLTGDMINPAGKKMLGEQPLAVLVEGTFPDTWAGKPVPAWPGDDGTAPPPAPATARPGRLLLVGCAKMFDDNVLGAMQNGLLLLNGVDYLAGSQALLSIRAKSLTDRVIKPVDAQAKVFWRLFTVLVVPALIAAYGIFRAGLRRKEATRYRENLRRDGGHQEVAR
jgi:ABC-2 type transport system permease protein